MSEDFQRSFENDMGRALAEMQARSGTARRLAPLLPGDEDAGIIMREAPARGAASISEMMESPTALEPRYNYDAPDLLQEQLIEPVLKGYGVDQPTVMPSQQRPVQPRITKAGSDTYMEDPVSGEWKLVVSGKNQPERLSARQQSEIRVAERELAEARKAMDAIPNDRDNVDARGEAVRRFRKAQQRHSGLVQPSAQAAPEQSVVPPVPDDIISQGKTFFGELGGANKAPQDQFVSVVNPSGKATRIKASDLERALKSGYKRR